MVLGIAVSRLGLGADRGPEDPGSALHFSRLIPHGSRPCRCGVAMPFAAGKIGTVTSVSSGGEVKLYVCSSAPEA